MHRRNHCASLPDAASARSHGQASPAGILRPGRAPARRAFARAELLALLTILVVAGIILAIAFPDSRRRAQLAGSLTNLQRLGAGAADYAIDHADAAPTLSWQAGIRYTCADGYSFPIATFDVDAAANQGVCLLRELTGRTDITQISPGWMPYPSYNQLVLMQYLGEALPSSLVVSPGDRLRLVWQRDVRENPSNPVQFCTSRVSGNAARRWPYSSSYEMAPAFSGPDAAMNGVPTISQGASHSVWNAGNGNTRLGRRVMSEVRFPSQKAMMYETNQRFFGQRELFFLYAEARVPVLMTDGSASVRSISQANRGFDPNVPSSNASPHFPYAPDTSWESPTRSGAAQEFVTGYTRWTRSGLRGRDFGGPEVPWVP